MHRSLTALAVFSLTLAAACGEERAAAGLPPEDTFYLPSPADEVSGLSSSSAVCASDSAAWDELSVRIDAYNEQLEGMKAALRALRLATARQLQREGEVELTAEREGTTLTLNAALAEDDSVDYVLTVDRADEEARTLLEGTMNADTDAGSWVVYRRDGSEAVDVTWSVDDSDVLTVNRTVMSAAATRTSVYTRDGDAVAVTFEGPNHAAEADWNLGTGEGSVTVEGEERLCFEAGEEAGDLCTVACAG